MISLNPREEIYCKIRANFERRTGRKSAPPTLPPASRLARRRNATLSTGGKHYLFLRAEGELTLKMCELGVSCWRPSEFGQNEVCTDSRGVVYVRFHICSSAIASSARPAVSGCQRKRWAKVRDTAEIVGFRV